MADRLDSDVRHVTVLSQVLAWSDDGIMLQGFNPWVQAVVLSPFLGRPGTAAAAAAFLVYLEKVRGTPWTRGRRFFTEFFLCLVARTRRFPSL